VTDRPDPSALDVRQLDQAEVELERQYHVPSFRIARGEEPDGIPADVLAWWRAAAMMSDLHTAERLDQFRHNATAPLREEDHGLLRRRRKAIELAATGRFLRQIDSPLIRP
jgi:hypothetical protein